MRLFELELELGGLGLIWVGNPATGEGRWGRHPSQGADVKTDKLFVRGRNATHAPDRFVRMKLAIGVTIEAGVIADGLVKARAGGVEANESSCLLSFSS